MPSSDIMVSSIFLGDIKTRLLSSPVYDPFSAYTPSLIRVGVQESWTGPESAVTMSTCVSFNMDTKAATMLSVHPSFVITCVVHIDLSQTHRWILSANTEKLSSQRWSGILSAYMLIITRGNEWMWCLYLLIYRKKKKNKKKGTPG